VEIRIGTYYLDAAKSSTKTPSEFGGMKHSNSFGHVILNRQTRPLVDITWDMTFHKSSNLFPRKERVVSSLSRAYHLGAELQAAEILRHFLSR
jgi:hypothetical protein